MEGLVGAGARPSRRSLPSSVDGNGSLSPESSKPVDGAPLEIYTRFGLVASPASLRILGLSPTTAVQVSGPAHAVYVALRTESQSHSGDSRDLHSRWFKGDGILLESDRETHAAHVVRVGTTGKHASLYLNACTPSARC